MINYFFKRMRAIVSRPTLEIYTDGSLKSGLGTWAYVVVQDGVVIRETFGRQRKTTSLRMEMRAVIEALEALPERSTGIVFSDCQILVDALNGNQPAHRLGPNSDLFEILDTLNRKHRIDWKWVRAHSGKTFNERCDQLCRLAHGGVS